MIIHEALVLIFVLVLVDAPFKYKSPDLENKMEKHHHNSFLWFVLVMQKLLLCLLGQRVRLLRACPMDSFSWCQMNGCDDFNGEGI